MKKIPTALTVGIFCVSESRLTGVLREDVARDKDAAGRGVGEGMGDAAAVADDVKAAVRGLKVLVERDLHVVELDLNAVEKRVVVRRAGGDLVEGVDHFDDAV